MSVECYTVLLRCFVAQCVVSQCTLQSVLYVAECVASQCCRVCCISKCCISQCCRVCCISVYAAECVASHSVAVHSVDSVAVLQSMLNEEGYSVWIDEAGIRAGHKWRNEIADGIQVQQGVVVVVIVGDDVMCM